jgi:hypothetical protein
VLVYDESGNQVVEKRSKGDWEKELEMLAVEVANSAPPGEPCMFVDDITPEKLALVMAQNYGRVAIVADEGGIFDIAGGRYSKSGDVNLDIFLKTWAADTPYLCNRVGDAGQSIRIEKPLITFVLSVQPDVFNNLQGRREFRGYGFLARFLYLFPPSMAGRRMKEPALMDAPIVDEYNANMRKILEIECPEAKGCFLAKVLKLSDEARQVLMDFKGELEPRFAEYRTWRR